jgi:glycosyltransferase involved in cell wall biosynthesis
VTIPASTAAPSSRDVPPAEQPLYVILVAPNVCERMGGEAIKALQIYEELVRQGVAVHQVTHGRVRDDLSRLHPDMPVTYIEDDRVSLFCVRYAVLRSLLDPYFMWRAAQVVRGMLRSRPDAIVHYTSPVSPIVPLFRIPGARVIVGPINGNIHYPPAFRSREGASYRVRRLLHSTAALVHRLFFPGKRSAQAILVAGGERTARSLRKIGCKASILRESLDSGIPNRLGTLPRITHEGQNFRFVHNGRLVPHKGADLIVKALCRTRQPVTLDIIGRGPEKPYLESLVRDLDLTQRVHFIDWFEDHRALAGALRQYRGFVLPSLAEANGIVVQEAMMYGLPVICLDWGGPGLLVTPESGVAIKPVSEEHVLSELARAMDQLGAQGALAERMSIVGRQRALESGFLWSDLIERWLGLYKQVQTSPGPGQLNQSGAQRSAP